MSYFIINDIDSSILINLNECGVVFEKKIHFKTSKYAFA
jgi:hypothetical protein